MPEATIPTASAATGIEAVKIALKSKAPGQRSIASLSRTLGLSSGAMHQWEKIPEEYLEEISSLTGLHPSVLRPDLAKLFSSEQGV